MNAQSASSVHPGIDPVEDMKARTMTMWFRVAMGVPATLLMGQ